jgi:hypothetical protein
MRRWSIGLVIHVLPHRAVAGIEHADALPQPAVELVGPGIEHLEHLQGAFQAAEQRPVDGLQMVQAWSLNTQSYSFSVKSFHLNSSLEQVIQELAAVVFGDHEDGVIVAGAGHLDVVAGEKEGPRLTGIGGRVGCRVRIAAHRGNRSLRRCLPMK